MISTITAHQAMLSVPSCQLSTSHMRERLTQSRRPCPTEKSGRLDLVQEPDGRLGDDARSLHRVAQTGAGGELARPGQILYPQQDHHVIGHRGVPAEPEVGDAELTANRLLLVEDRLPAVEVSRR